MKRAIRNTLPVLAGVAGVLWLQGCGIPEGLNRGADEAANWILTDGRGVAGSLGIVAVGPIDTPVEQWRRMARITREGLIDRLREEERFALVVTPAPRQPLPGSITVTGQLIDVREGNEIARFLVGFGLGRVKIRSRFDIRDEYGQTLASFEVTETHKGGSIMSFAEQWDQIYPEDVASNLGAEAATAVIRFSAGHDINPPKYFGFL